MRPGRLPARPGSRSPTVRRALITARRAAVRGGFWTVRRSSAERADVVDLAPAGVTAVSLRRLARWVPPGLIRRSLAGQFFRQPAAPISAPRNPGHADPPQPSV